MNKIKLYLLGIIALCITGCTNQNSLSLGTVQDSKNIQYKENDYVDILIQKDIAGSSESEARINLNMMLQKSAVRVNFIKNISFSNERVFDNSWFDVTNDFIIYEDNLRNILKDKRDINSQNLNLGGTYGNRMYKIVLPYKLVKVNEKTYNITIFNNENLEFVESINNSTNKPYVENFDVKRFKNKVNGIFKGVVGADVNISSINSTIKSVLEEKKGRFFVIDSNQKLLLYDDESKVGKSTAEVLSNGTSKNDEILSAIKEKKTGLYDYYDENGDRCIAHVSEAKIFNEGEVSVLVIPYSFISKTIGEIIGIGLILIVLALSIVYFVTVYIVRGIVLPVEKVTNVLKALGDGDFDKASHVDVKTHDEIETMATSLNSLYDSIEEVAVFAENIGSGKLSVEFKSKGNGDILGNSLIKMREGLVKADEEAKLRKMEDEKQSWIERSVANFGKELRNEHGDTKSFYNNIIRIIVRDLEVNQAALYLINDNDESSKFFEVVACMAWGREKMQKKMFMLEEGLLGACYFEREPIVLTEIPEDYVSITSGLGGANPTVLMLVPLIYNENVIGVV